MKHLALLRGINVSGHNMIKMEALKTTLEAIGFTNVVTYIQSGNVLFRSKEKDSKDKKKKIENAIEKLTEKLENRQQKQDLMKKVNALIRKKDTAGLVALVGEKRAAELQQPDFCGRIGFASYSLQNNNAEINRLKKRIAQLTQAAEREDVEEEHEGYTYKEEENRCQFVFDGKPDEETRTKLKNNGFKWSPSRMAWVRQSTPNGRAAAARVKAAL